MHHRALCSNNPDIFQKVLPSHTQKTLYSNNTVVGRCNEFTVMPAESFRRRSDLFFFHSFILLILLLLLLLSSSFFLFFLFPHSFFVFSFLSFLSFLFFGQTNIIQPTHQSHHHHPKCSLLLLLHFSSLRVISSLKSRSTLTFIGSGTC